MVRVPAKDLALPTVPLSTHFAALATYGRKPLAFAMRFDQQGFTVVPSNPSPVVAEAKGRDAVP